MSDVPPWQNIALPVKATNIVAEYLKFDQMGSHCFKVPFLVKMESKDEVWDIEKTLQDLELSSTHCDKSTQLCSPRCEANGSRGRGCQG